MSNLKTLKEMGEAYHFCVHGEEGYIGDDCYQLVDKKLKLENEGIYFSEKDLKQEAIKHIQEHQETDDEDKHSCDVCAWIKDFFNITEEDLK